MNQHVQRVEYAICQMPTPIMATVLPPHASCTQRIPRLVGDAVDARFGPSVGGHRRFDARTDRARELVDLVVVETDRVNQLERRPPLIQMAPVLRRIAASDSTRATSAVSRTSSDRPIAVTMAARPYISLSLARCSASRCSR